MELRRTTPLFATKSRVAGIEKLLSSGTSRTRLEGLAGSAPACLLSALKRRDVPMILIADDLDDAGYMYSDLAHILGEDAVKILPSGFKRDIRFGQPDAPARILRTEAIDAWQSDAMRWIVTYPEAIAERVPAKQLLGESTLRLRTGDTYRMDDIRATLLKLGFSRTDYVYEPGQFAIRGSILDIFSYSAELPFRIDFFDDEVDSIRIFDIETQLSERKLDEVSIIPDIEPASCGNGISLLEFAGNQAVIFCRSESRVTERVDAICSASMSDSALHSGEADINAMSALVDAGKFRSDLHGMQLIEFGSAFGFRKDSEAVITFDCAPQTLYHKNFDLISGSFAHFLADGYTIYILSDSDSQNERLKAIFSERDDDIQFTPVHGTLHEGFVDRKLKRCFFTDHQIFDRFHKYTLRADRARSGKLALSLKELNNIETGDYIVHQDHGIGKFGGLVRTDAAGKPQEMIKLLYQGDDIIFVSIHSLHKLSKYRGKEGVPPKLNKLGSGAWNRLKEKTKKKVKDIARDLIRLYAARREEKGFAFSPDTYLQHELEASFIYEDTPDQLKAVNAVKADMESTRPMDRLICGDVGFGKTEIAVRAAFKAAVDGKQTAVLVPTTVLAFQHYQTFSNRLANLPVRVDFISRAKKPKEVKQILTDLTEGKIDILIGTHKIIGKDVKFKDLGLLIIDEEQKFGVAVKEKLKQLKVNVDTLTMSATPIPRTLQFSLMGARDLSSLNTPPANRHPILTTVTSFSDDIVQEAINFEVSRGGQVFFISNRIEQLTQLENTLHRLIPGLRVATGHGQMPPEQLERTICDFAKGDYDVLLSTTIVENGIDMPNVNTIIINNAQNFGLSELHQLRGRVGRSNRKAFCYMLTPPGMTLTTVARRRLQAIESFSDLGSGIHIAMQDLDIRGAGNLLGAEQSGFIADLGYETYQRILKESVIELRTEEFADTFAEENAAGEQEFTADCVVESDMELLIPPAYVPQESERINLYRKLDSMEQEEDVETFRESLRDRFGLIPYPTEELIRIVPLRSTARRLGIERLNLKQGKMFLYFVDAANEAYYTSPAFGRILTYVQTNPRKVQIRDIKGKRSIVVADVKSVMQALDILSLIAGLPSA